MNKRKNYASMKAIALTSLKGKTCSLHHMFLTQMMRLHQITCGHLKLDNDEIVDLKIIIELDELMECT
jgi:hypothetical protein